MPSGYGYNILVNLSPSEKSVDPKLKNYWQ